MSTFRAVYVRTAAAVPAVAAALHALFPLAEEVTNSRFSGVTMSDEVVSVPEHALHELSARFKTDVVWLSYQSAVDAFQFHHWQDGKHERALVYGCVSEERTWERAEGTPEPWEHEVFFGQKEGGGLGRDVEIQPGRTEPCVDARECARTIAHHCQFPGWGL